MTTDKIIFPSGHDRL